MLTFGTLTAAVFCGALVTAITGDASGAPAVMQEWDFTKGVQGWRGVNTTPLRVEDGALVYGPTAPDLFVLSPTFSLKPEFGDIIEIRLRTTARGVAQLFWRSDLEGQYQGFSTERCLDVALDPTDDWQTLRIWPFWHDAPQVIGFRFDGPETGSGEYAVSSIRIVRAGLDQPVSGDFDFSAGTDLGWSTTSGAAESAEGGLRAHLAGPNARVVSPPLSLDASKAPWLQLDITAPPATDAARLRAILEWAAPGSRGLRGLPFWVVPGRRQTLDLKLAGLPDWTGPVPLVMLGLLGGTPGDLTLHSLRFRQSPGGGGGLDGPATGLEFQTEGWRTEARVAASLSRIDVATSAPPETHPVPSDYTVSMWYFAAWEPEYTWDGWRQVAERSPWRMPLLYDSEDAEMRYNGIQYYRSSNPRVVDWHIHWMREHAVNLMLFDWYPQTTDGGEFSPLFFGNRALEVGFLGKATPGGPAVATNRFADTMQFAVMWTNHPPHDRVGAGLAEYMVEQLFSQPNYYKIDGKPLVPLWSPRTLVNTTGGVEQAKAALDHLREVARAHGFPGVYIVGICETDRDLLTSIGIDGVTGYNYLCTGGYRTEPRRIGEKVVKDLVEDFPTQTIPGQVRTWQELADRWGRDYLLATMPMQNLEPTYRAGNPVVERQTPDAFREMLRRAKATIEQRGLRKFVNIEAWNEWLEGSYVEPSTQWGYGYLEAIRDILGKPAEPPPPGP